MPTDVIANAVIKGAQESHDPMITGLAFVLIIVILLIAISKPIMGLVKDYKKNGADNAKAEAEAQLYEQLQKQIVQNADAITKMNLERNVWFEKSMHLEREVDRLKTFEETVISMKERLNEKDRIIELRDAEIRKLTHSILEMKDRLHALELRLVQDEQKFCSDCAFKVKVANETPANS